MKNPKPAQVKVNDTFFGEYMKLIRDVVIPYQYHALNDEIEGAEPSHAIRNFRIAAGEIEGEFGGFVFQDSDLAKWIEAAAYAVSLWRDEELEKLIDKVVDLIVRSQQPDGYINTYFTIKEPDKRFTDLLNCHELYCAGHMMEAAVAYYEATGKDSLLNAMCRFADYLISVFGPGENQLHGYPGHPEIELALMRLSQTTGNIAYQNLAEYFIDERGKQPNYFDAEWERNGSVSFWTKRKSEHPNLEHMLPDYREYNQFHRPVREQDKAVGHAVRALYLYAGMADIAAATGDVALKQACKTLYKNVTQKQMYITGGVGSTAIGEAFTFDYDLPNDTVYAETCASIALILFAHRMMKLDSEGDYADVIERVIYNILPASIQKDGRHFFYTNPLEVWPERLKKSPVVRHLKSKRQKWFGCACCPPNLARTLLSLGQYIYSQEEDVLSVHQFIGSQAFFEVNGQSVCLTMESGYPYSGKVALHVASQTKEPFTIRIRKPRWCREMRLFLNGDEIRQQACQRYFTIRHTWGENETISIDMEMKAEYMVAHPQVRADAGKIAVQRGPLVYCFEEADNGPNLSAFSMDRLKTAEIFVAEGFDTSIVALKLYGWERIEENWEGLLYRSEEDKPRARTIIAIPYALWGNRGEGEMCVWIRGERYW